MRFTAYLFLLSLDRAKQAAPPSFLVFMLAVTWRTRFGIVSKADRGGQISAVAWFVNGNQTNVSM